MLCILAYGYLFYRLFTFQNYADFLAHFTTIDICDCLLLFASIVLFPLNIFLESVKWRTLLQEIAPISKAESWRQTCVGFVGAFITPNRLGDYPTRAAFLQNKTNWLSAISLGFVGTFAMDIIIAFLGLPAVLIFFTHYFTDEYQLWWIWLFFGIYIILLLFFKPIIAKLANREWKNEQIKMVIEALANITIKRFITITIQSILRYIVWFVQLYIVLYFCGVELSVNQALIAILAYYFLITITPSMPIADIAIRGSWSIIVFATFVPNEPAIAMAITLIWLINTIFPMLLGTWYSLKRK